MSLLLTILPNNMTARTNKTPKPFEASKIQKMMTPWLYLMKGRYVACLTVVVIFCIVIFWAYLVRDAPLHIQQCRFVSEHQLLVVIAFGMDVMTGLGMHGKYPA